MYTNRVDVHSYENLQNKTDEIVAWTLAWISHQHHELLFCVISSVDVGFAITLLASF